MKEYRYMSAKVFADGWVTREEVKVSVTGKPDQAGSVTILKIYT